MITVYYTKVSPFLEEDAFFAHLEKAEEDRRKKNTCHDRQKKQDSQSYGRQSAS